MPGDKASENISQQIVTSNQNTKMSGYPASATTTYSQTASFGDRLLNLETPARRCRSELFLYFEVE